VYVHKNDYWCGVFYEEEVENYLLKEVGRGDTVVDVGMNVGHVSIPAAALVGKEGAVFAFEPNIELVKQVRAMAEEQNLVQLVIFPFGLSDREGVFDLHLDPRHTGGASFRDNNLDGDLKTKVLRCATKRGENSLDPNLLSNRVFLKMDVEGHELEALKGMGEVMGKIDHAIIEVSPEWIGLGGVEAMFSLMRTYALSPHFINADGSVGRKIAACDVTSQINVLFLHEKS
jgi:FkbM family methyltransferase